MRLVEKLSTNVLNPVQVETYSFFSDILLSFQDGW